MKPHPPFRTELVWAVVAVLLCLPCAARAQQETDAATRQFATAARLQNLESYDLAAAQWQKFLQEHPADPRSTQVRHNLGVCYYLDNKLQQAQSELQAVIQSDPKFDLLDATYLYLGAAQYGLARAGNAALYQAAIDTFGQLAAKYPQSKYLPDAIYYRAECLYLQGKKKEAIPLYTQLLNDHPDHKFAPEALYALGVAQEESGEAEAAGRSYDAFLQKYPKHALTTEVNMRRGETLFAQGKFSEAAQRFADAAAVPGFAMADFAMVRHADALSRMKQYDNAAKLYAEVAAKYPKSKYLAAADLAGGTCYYLAGDMAAARQLLQRSVDTGGPTAPEAAHWMAQSWLKEKKPAEALAVVTSVLPKASNSTFLPQLLLDQADAVYEIPDRRKESVGLYADLAAKHPKQSVAPQALYMAGFAARELGDYDAARKYAEAFLKIYPDDRLVPDVSHVLAESALLSNHLSEAEQLYARLLKQFPDHADAHLWQIRRALAFQLQKKHAEVIELLAPMLATLQNPDLQAEAQFLIGTSQLEMNQPEAAIKSLEASLAAQPKWLQADATLLALAQAYRRQQDFAAARKAVQRLIDEFPESKLLDKAHFRLGEYAFLTGDSETAAAQYGQVVDVWPNSPLVPYALHELGCVQLSRKELPAAEKTLSRLLDEYGKHEIAPRARYARGMVRQQAGKYAEALDDLQAALSAKPAIAETSNARFLVGLCQVELKQYDAAAATFRSLLKDDPSYSAADRARYQLAWSLKLAGKQAEAADAFDQLAEKHPDSPLAAEALHNVGQFAYDAKDYIRSAKAYYAAMQKSDDAELAEKAAYKYGWSFYHLRDFDNAQKAFQYQRGMYPKGPLAPEAAFMEAECLYEQKKYPEALAAYDQVKGLADKEYQALALLHAGQAAAQLQQWDRSIELLSRIAKEFPDFASLPEALCEQGWAEQNRGNLDAALALFAQVVSKGNGEAAARAQFLTGEVQFAKKDHAAAISSYFKVAYGYSYPKWQALATYEAGRCFEVLGKKTQAVKQYQELIDKYPDSDKVPLANQRIKELKG